MNLRQFYGKLVAVSVLLFQVLPIDYFDPKFARERLLFRGTESRSEKRFGPHRRDDCGHSPGSLGCCMATPRKKFLYLGKGE